MKKNPRVQSVTPCSDYTLTLQFTNGEVKRFDVNPYLTKGFFRELQSMNYFQKVHLFLQTVQWPNGQDFCPDTLYLESQPLTEIENPIAELG